MLRFARYISTRRCENRPRPPCLADRIPRRGVRFTRRDRLGTAANVAEAITSTKGRVICARAPSGPTGNRPTAAARPSMAANAPSAIGTAKRGARCASQARNVARPSVVRCTNRSASSKVHKQNVAKSFSTESYLSFTSSGMKADRIKSINHAITS